jgi:ribonuclease Z
VSELSEGLHVVSCGSGTPLPDLTMAGVCTAVIAGGKLLVFDVGEGAPKTLASVVNHEFAYFQKASNAIL